MCINTLYNDFIKNDYVFVQICKNAGNEVPLSRLNNAILVK